MEILTMIEPAGSTGNTGPRISNSYGYVVVNNGAFHTTTVVGMNVPLDSEYLLSLNAVDKISVVNTSGNNQTIVGVNCNETNAFLLVM